MAVACTPVRSMKTPRGEIGRAFVVYLEAKRIAVSRDMRFVPAVAAAFIEGAREQGADVVDYGMLATDMMYAVARDGHDGGAQITASHNPKQYNGIKLWREAFPLSGEEGLSDIRDMIVERYAARNRRPAGLALAHGCARRLRQARAVVYRSENRQALQRGAGCR